MIQATMPMPQQMSRKPPRQHDHSAFYPTIRTSDVFLCSYPKSGVTWLALMIAHATKQGDDEQLDLKSYNRYVPDVNAAYTKRGSLAEFAGLRDPRVFHCNALADLRLPKVVYLMRDPRDVMVSCWHYRHYLQEGFRPSLAEYISGDDHSPCEWDEHVASWMLADRQHPNLLVVRYEDIHKDASGVLRSVLNFAGIRCDAERLAAAVESARFENMRAAEERFGVHDKASDPTERFIRRGRVGSWQEEMGYKELRIIEEKYGDVMRQVGYQPLS